MQRDAIRLPSGIICRGFRPRADTLGSRNEPFGTPAVSLGELVAELRGTRGDVKIVGHSATPLHKLYFAALGVKRFLTKPWGVTDLIEVLA